MEAEGGTEAAALIEEGSCEEGCANKMKVWIPVRFGDSRLSSPDEGIMEVFSFENSGYKTFRAFCNSPNGGLSSYSWA